MMRRLRRDDGQAAVEFMLLFPFVLIVILLLIEFGFAFFTYVTVNNTASEAARWAALGKPAMGCVIGAVGDTVEERAVEASGGVVKCASSTPEVEVTYRGFDGSLRDVYSRGDQVIVKIAHTYSPITPVGTLMSTFSFGNFPDTFTMKACSNARLENVYTGSIANFAQAGCES